MKATILPSIVLAASFMMTVSHTASAQSLFREQASIPSDLVINTEASGAQGNTTSPAPVEPQTYDSCQALLEAGNTTSGTYTLNGTTPVYCDMVNNGGGWMLYLDFGSSAARPALVANQIDTPEEALQHASSSVYSHFNRTVSNSTSEFTIEPYRDEWVNFYHWGGTVGYLDFTAPAGYTSMRVDYGNGYWLSSNYSSSFVRVNRNGVTQSTVYQPSARGSISRASSTFNIAGGESVTISEANAVNYLDAIWVR